MNEQPVAPAISEHHGVHRIPLVSRKAYHKRPALSRRERLESHPLKYERLERAAVKRERKGDLLQRAWDSGAWTSTRRWLCKRGLEPHAFGLKYGTHGPSVCIDCGVPVGGTFEKVTRS